MLSNYLLAFALFAPSLNALPLNINLGAYSPALVVGDGEISFGGRQDVSNLMNALQGASQGAAQAAATAAAPAPPAAAAPAQAPAAAAAVQPADSTSIQTAPADQAAQVTALQGMGKEIAPRVVQLHATAHKRDLQGFNAALNYASAALKTSPEVQLGTGKEGSGVGITQKAGAARVSAPRARREVVARDFFSPKMKTTVTTMFVRGGSLAVEEGSQDSSLEKREPAEPNPSAIDHVNLNMAEGQIAELTFVETKEVDADDADEEDE
ncbi:hypothetical protein PZA11_003116 [Diplocarpon coronariae]|uniref:Uncharacterized protein n=1 Tax=Diplocarpon coronariae TaxID=2795749 RepID=A0A218Z8N2_9HELO|nr:hypothetical protein JHW43_008983 [Diplocarpon mali]OWP04348.1 hypothetical protein B2J93_5981 [Marssonina coronariae]